MSLIGDALAAIKSVLLMQASVERVERQVDRLGDDQAGFREALIQMNNRLIRVETILDERFNDGRRTLSLPRE